MKKIKLFNLLCLTLLMAVGSYWAHGQESINIPLTTPGERGKIFVEVRYGPVTIKGTSRSNVVVNYEPYRKDVEDEEAETRDGLRKIGHATMDLEVAEKNNSVYVESDSWSRGIRLDIEIPTGFDVHVDAYNKGVVMISDVNGEVVVETYNGGVTVENISGSVVADTYNGPIKVTFNSVTEGKAMAFSTYNGDVDLTFPASFKGDFKMKTERGEIYTDFEMIVNKGEPRTVNEKRSGVTKVYLDDWVRAQLNGGGPEVIMKNYNGDLFIRRKG